tara:strand:- start:57 stop:326 length:270 start_codon:yes stop_codon:yes gene_type:complete
MRIEQTLTDSIIHSEDTFRLTTVRDALAFALTAEPLAAVVQVFDNLGEKALEQVVNAVKAIEPGCEFVVRGEYLVAGSSMYKCPSLTQG